MFQTHTCLLVEVVVYLAVEDVGGWFAIRSSGVLVVEGGGVNQGFAQAVRVGSLRCLGDFVGVESLWVDGVVDVEVGGDEEEGADFLVVACRHVNIARYCLLGSVVVAVGFCGVDYAREQQ